MNSFEKLKEELCFFCHLLYERHLATGTGGNITARHEDRILCTPSGVSLRTVEPASICVVDMNGKRMEGASPTKEMGMHLGILKIRPEINVVFHLHGAHIIAASTLLHPGPDALPPLTPGFVYHAHPVPMLPFMIPGSRDLGKAAAESLSTPFTHALLLQNHGLVTVGKDFEAALNMAEEVDEAARIYVLTRGKASLIPAHLVPEIKAIERQVDDPYTLEEIGLAVKEEMEK